MPRAIADVNVLQEYLRGVLRRAAHHAPHVGNVALAIAGAIVWRKDRQDLEVMQQDGDMKNVLWVHIDSRRYALSYNHAVDAIEVREGSTRGEVLRAFTDADGTADVRAFFESLGNGA